MYDKGESLERVGEKSGAERRGEYASTWENAMNEGVPEFNGGMPWGYAPEQASAMADAELAAQSLNDNEVVDDAETGVEKRGPKNAIETGRNIVNCNDNLEGASKITSYGLDTASRIYGLETVLDTIKETDETDRDSANPIGSIYTRLVPDPTERQGLFREIQRDPMDITDMNTESDASPTRPNDAVKATKDLLEAIETSEAFEGARGRAEAEGKTIIQYLAGNEANPTLSMFLDQTGAELGLGAEAALAELEEIESEKDQAEEQNAEEEKDSETEEEVPEEVIDYAVEQIDKADTIGQMTDALNDAGVDANDVPTDLNNLANGVDFTVQEVRELKQKLIEVVQKQRTGKQSSQSTPTS